MPKKPQLIPLRERVSPIHCCEQFHVTPLQFAILSLIQRVAHKEGASFYVSIQDLAEPIGLSPEAIRQALHALTAAGWLKVCGRGRTVHYKAVTHEEWSGANPGCCCQKRERVSLTARTIPAEGSALPAGPAPAPVMVAPLTSTPVSSAVVKPVAELAAQAARAWQESKKPAEDPVQAAQDGIATASSNGVVYGKRDSAELAKLVREYGPEAAIESFREFWQKLDEFQQKHAPKDFLDKAPQLCRMWQKRQEERRRQGGFAAAQLAVIEEQARAEAAALAAEEADAEALAAEAFAEFEDQPTRALMIQ